MTTLLEVLNFVKNQVRIPLTSTNEDTWLKQAINESQLSFARRKQWPQLRATGTFTTTSAQSYDLETDFETLLDGSIRYYYGSTPTTDSATSFLTMVSQNNAELYRGLPQGSDPIACQVIAGTTGASKKLILLPDFTNTGATVEYGYIKKPAELTLDADVLALPELSEAIAWDVCSQYMNWLRDKTAAGANYYSRSRRCYFDALATIIQQ